MPWMRWCSPVDPSFSSKSRPGGDGLERHFRFLEPMTVGLLSGSRRVAQIGRAEGGAGCCGTNQLERVDGSLEELPGCVQLELQAGEGLIIATPGGGGWGSLGRSEGPEDIGIQCVST